MNDKTFPIKQGVACSLKWTWNTLRLYEGTTACCHRVNPIALSVDNFDNFHNDPVWIAHREMQLAGKFPQQGCQWCEKIEQLGGISDRLLHNTNDLGVYPVELDQDPLQTHVKPRILEVFLNNICNMACIYCDESNSSKIELENKKFGYRVEGVPFQNNINNIISMVPEAVNHQQLTEKFFSYLELNYKNLKKLHILGGEPFYQKEFDRLLNFIISQTHSELELTVVSNLKVSQTQLQEFVDKIRYALVNKKIKNITITASLDCFGDEQEYTRYGIVLSEWKKNFEFLHKHKWIKMGVNSTITSLSLKTMPDLIDYINDLSKYKKIYHSFGAVDGEGKVHMHPKIFPNGFFNDDFEKILSTMPDSTDLDKMSKSYMLGTWQAVNKFEENLELQKHLMLYLNEIDRRRDTCWKNIFPWLYNYFKSIEYVV